MPVLIAEGGRSRIGKLYCVDTWQNDAMSEGQWDTYSTFLTNTEPYKEIITPLRGRSADVSSQFTGMLDMLFIDGDHNYDGVRDDALHWLPKLCPGGWLLMHDWGWAEGVQRVIREIVVPLQIAEPETLPNLYAVQIDSKRMLP